MRLMLVVAGIAVGDDRAAIDGEDRVKRNCEHVTVH
jgi:hypothetical protein